MSSSASKTHPLTQIAESPTHKLLLKQWLKEEALICRRIAVNEHRIDSVRREMTTLYCSFFLFHSLILLLLFSSGASAAGPAACRRSWVPCVASLACSLAILWGIRYKTDTELHIERLLVREREDGLLLIKCVEELKRKGVDFDLLKEVDALRRAKSLRVNVEVRENKVRKWSTRDLGMMVLFGFACGVVGLTRIVLCA